MIHVYIKVRICLKTKIFIKRVIYLKSVIAVVKKDLVNFITSKGFSINENSLNILIEAEELCYRLNINFFSSDLLLPLIKRFTVFGEIIDKYGGNRVLAVEIIERRLNSELEFRDKYYTIKYLVEELSNCRYIIINECMKHAKEDNRSEIQELDILLSLLDVHDKEFPLYDNSGIIDTRFHTPFNTLSHIILEYSEYLWVKNDDIRWEVKYSNKRSYDIAISFAGKNRNIAMEIAEKLTATGIKVFYDKYEKGNLWGKDLYTYLSEIYGERAKYCLMVVSESYKKEFWPNLERQAAQAKAFKESDEYILPLRLDDTEIPGLLPTIGYIDMRYTSINEVVSLIIEKISTKRDI